SADITLMDVQMPVMDGFTSVGLMRERGIEKTVVALTADAMEGAEQKCLEAGYSRYLTKPVNIDKLLGVLAEELGGTRETVSTSEVAATPVASPTEPETARTETARAVHETGTSTEQPEEPARAAATATASAAMAATASAAAAPAAAISAAGPLIYCTLPVSNARLRDIAQSFLNGLGAQLQAMREAEAADNLEELAALAHKLKGTAGSVGFPAMTEPAAELQDTAKANKADACGPLIARLENLQQRFRLEDTGEEVAETAPQTGAAAETMPDSIASVLAGRGERFDSIIVSFADKLGSQIDAMDQHLAAGDLDELAKLAHWLKGSAGSVGFGGFTEPAATLEQAAKKGDTELAAERITFVKEMSRRIVVPEADNRGINERQASP
ncbi:MAG: Hpt domain-containing protein, partial [Halieaceae bacterium]|nr:Hpt domain-containing protein [Halieaceae bacterium]